MGTDGSLLVLVFALCGAGALVGVVVPERHNPTFLAWAGSLAALAALWVSADVLRSGRVFHDELWTIQPLGTLTVSLDRLSALFLFVAAVVVLASSVFSASYLKRYLGHYSLKALNAWYLLLFASIALILIADDALLFLLAWEAMSITSYLLVTFENQRDESSRAGYLMLAMGEGGFVAVVVALPVPGRECGLARILGAQSRGRKPRARRALARLSADVLWLRRQGGTGAR